MIIEGFGTVVTYVVIVDSTWFESPVDRGDKGADVEIDE